MKMYKADFADGEFEIFEALDDNMAIIEADGHGEEHGDTFNVFEIDDDYDEIRTIL